ncbi:biopolymer transport ExbD/TolR family protein [Paraburkholderia xenovorans LB400]|nr:biopolymer transport ExbD/TolR family protein [Paraburkholderia xenovorans LB400]
MENEENDGIVGDINMTPLIDVMLVLLIIFIVTLPIMNRALRVDLPKEAAKQNLSHDDAIDLSVEAGGAVFWNRSPVDDAQLAQKARSAADAEPTPVVRIYADRHVEYRYVMHVLSVAQSVGLSKLEFVTAPVGQSTGPEQPARQKAGTAAGN